MHPDEPINIETAAATGLSQEKIEAEGVDFEPAIEKVSFSGFNFEIKSLTDREKLSFMICLIIDLFVDL